MTEIDGATIERCVIAMNKEDPLVIGCLSYSDKTDLVRAVLAASGAYEEIERLRADLAEADKQSAKAEAIAWDHREGGPIHSTSPPRETPT